jgi:hypothetical protein
VQVEMLAVVADRRRFEPVGLALLDLALGGLAYSNARGRRCVDAARDLVQRLDLPGVRVAFAWKGSDVALAAAL